MSGAPTVIVPSFNGAHLLRRLLPSLRAQTLRPDVIVVDNASTDDTAAVLATEFPEVGRLMLPSNLGFGSAIKRGVAACPASVLVFLNNDVVCEPAFVERLVGALDPARGVVMAAGVLLSGSKPDRIDTAGILFDRTLFAIDHLHGAQVSVLDGDVSDPLGPTGGAAAFDRAAFTSVGGFDERFFAYLEDVDLAVRLVARGGRCRLSRGARAGHHHSATLGSGSRRKNALMGWARGYTLAKYRLHKRPALFARALLGELVVASGQLTIDRTAAGFASRIRGFRAGLTAPPEPLPSLPAEALQITFADGLRYRLRRRSLRSR